MSALGDPAILQNDNAQIFSKGPVEIGREIILENVGVRELFPTDSEDHVSRVNRFPIHLKSNFLDTAERKASVVVDGNVYAVTVLFTMLPHVPAVMLGQNMAIVHKSFHSLLMIFSQIALL
jgi:hypothetical protein